MTRLSQTGAGEAGTTPGGDAERPASLAPAFSWSYPGHGCGRADVPAPTPAGAARHNRPRRCAFPAGIVQEAD